MSFSKTLLIVSAACAIASCSASQPQSRAEASAAPKQDEMVCSGFGGIKGRVCHTSILKLLAHPERFEGRTVSFRGYVHAYPENSGAEEIHVFPTQEWITGEGDASNSIACVPRSGPGSCGQITGHSALLFGHVVHNNSADGFLHRPELRIELIYARSFNPRFETEPRFPQLER